jgi:multiple sugar transport system permease protein
MKKESTVKNVIIVILLCLGSVMVAIPFIWMLLSSFKTQAEFYVNPPRLLPEKFTLTNFKTLFDRIEYGRVYLNSIFVTTVQVLLNIIIVTTAGYGFAKYKFVGKKTIFSIVLATTMIPWVSTIIPLYIMAYKAGVVDTYFGLIFPGLADAFSIFLARNFISTVPDSFIESARMDGGGEFKIFRSIVIPLVKPIIAVIVINKFIGSWNAFIWPLLVVTSEKHSTLPLAIAKLSGQFNDQYDLKMASALLAILPVLIIYVTFQKYFVKGISLTGVKG